MELNVASFLILKRLSKRKYLERVLAAQESAHLLNKENENSTRVQ